MINRNIGAVLAALGFSALLSADAMAQTFEFQPGAEVLQGIIDERPRSKLAKSAKNKLKLTGHLDDD